LFGDVLDSTDFHIHIDSGEPNDGLGDPVSFLDPENDVSAGNVRQSGYVSPQLVAGIVVAAVRVALEVEAKPLLRTIVDERFDVVGRYVFESLLDHTSSLTAPPDTGD
jgi:hypothetical protein